MKILLLAVLLAVNAKHSLQELSGVLNISLYYESLCPYCFEFITKQLHPAYQKIGSHLLIDLIPYGNTERKKENNTWVYECQHGPAECAINKIEACGLAKNDDQDKQIEFVNCVEIVVESDVEDYKETADCAVHLELTGKEILKCSEGPEGDVLYGKLADKQSEAGRIDGVPWINIDGMHDEDFESAALENFFIAACDKFPDPKPTACPTNMNNVTESFT